MRKNNKSIKVSFYDDERRIRVKKSNKICITVYAVVALFFLCLEIYGYSVGEPFNHPIGELGLNLGIGCVKVL